MKAGEWTFPITPVAASRPRVVRGRGGYFLMPYKGFRQDMADLVPEVLGEFVPLEGRLEVDLELYVKRPKTTKLSEPAADLDNYIKSVFDSLNTHLWIDDKQIIKLYAQKAWAQPDEPGYFIIGVSTLD